MKNFKPLFLSAFAAVVLYSCGGENKPATTEDGSATAAPAGDSGTDLAKYDPDRGLGKWNESNVDVSKFDPAMAEAGKKIADTKCTSCHKMTDERLVGPGWKGVTERHKPYWIMNFITEPDPMIDADPKLQAQLELCLVRMPNQNLTDANAREILEFMRQNDGAK